MQCLERFLEWILPIGVLRSGLDPGKEAPSEQNTVPKIETTGAIHGVNNELPIDNRRTLE